MSSVLLVTLFNNLLSYTVLLRYGNSVVLDQKGLNAKRITLVYLMFERNHDGDARLQWSSKERESSVSTHLIVRTVRYAVTMAWLNGLMATQTHQRAYYR